MEKLDKERYLKRVIIVCWIALAICFGIKLFGGNLFEIMCENENFIKVCEYADNHFWAKYLICFAYALASDYFYVLAVCEKLAFTKRQFIIFLLTVIVATLIKLINSTIGLIFEIWQFVIMPCIFTIKEPKKHWNSVIGVFLVFIFQVISMFAKNVEFAIMGDSVLVGAIFSIDVFLMIVLYYGYMNVRKRKGE
jgi:hypothetical protein